MTRGKWIALGFVATWIVAMLIHATLRPGFRAGKELIRAINRDDRPAVERLLRSGASLSIRDPQSRTPLHLAAEMGKADVVKQLLDRGASPENRKPDGFTPLMDAVRLGHVEVARVLIQRGARVNVEGNAGETPLALAKEYPAIADLLRQSGAKP
jgi:ankyrin repeat protein